MPAGAYGLLLWLPAPEAALRDRPEYAIRLATEGLWDADHGWHDLGLAVEVQASDEPSDPNTADGRFELIAVSP